MHARIGNWFSLHSALLTLGLAVLPTNVSAQTLGSDFSSGYSVRNLGTAGDIPAPYGALSFKLNDSNTLLVGGNADDPTAKIYQIAVTRDAQKHITGLAATSSSLADAPGIPPEQPLDVAGGIDGGMDYGPNGVLFYTSYHDGAISQIKPASTAPNKQIRMSSLGIDGAGGALAFVPAGFPGTGRLKLAGASSTTWFDSAVTSDGTGTFNIALSAKSVEIVDYAQGVVYVKAGATAFAQNSVLITSQLDNRVVAYEIDANGDPLPGTLREFFTGFYQVKGATMDPVTGDFLFASGDANNPDILLVGNLSVGPAQVHITSPAEGSSFTSVATFPVNADASQADGAIARVDFYLGATLFGSAAHAPFSALADSLSAGAYTLTAVAIDGGGIATTSAPVHVSVVNNGPHITLLSPTNNTTLAACTDLTLVAQVQPGNSDIASVEFFDGVTSLGVSHAPYDFTPYTWRVLDLVEGTRMFSVQVTDASGLSSVAVATNIVVQPLPLNKLVIHHYVTNQLKFCFKGSPGSNYVWETSAVLTPVQWAPFLTNTATVEKLQVTNLFDSHVPTGFYRNRMSN